jgi:NADPH-dependent 2,4-dienoyl-CoA reductase/sulfur reductase-like enzyme
MRQDVILEHAFGALAGAWFDRRLRGHGVDVRPRSAVTSIARRHEGLRVTLAEGDALDVDRVVVGAGVVASTRLAEDAGLELAGGGIAVDAHLRTSAPGVFAIGDVAAYESELHGQRVRIEHWDVARAHGAHVAGEITGVSNGAFRVLPYFFGTLGDWAFLEYAGLGGGRAVMRGVTEGDDMSIAFLDDRDVLRGLLAVGRPDDLAAARELVLERARLAPASVADDDILLAACRLEQPAVAG